ncbi:MULTISPECIES: FecR family protein [Niastella]|uniref:FecR domain-containing protein n=1 Tax=Niastella soli TaxID=2821487 RepID=A0ABS3YZC1_9BACT|nr:FecR family protein [Niastella soli]MBO9203271.1 FecR domain-containing protein [Niastella soli]
MPHNSHIEELIIKHLQETITAEEAYALQQWIDANEKNRLLFDQFINSEALQQKLIAHAESDRRIQERVYNELPEMQATLKISPKRGWVQWMSVAAAVLVVVSIGWFIWQGKTKPAIVAEQQQTPVATVIPAGGNKATLTLADGTVIDLDKAGNGTIATEGKTTVNKKEDGQLEYKSVTGSNATEVTFNLLTTPRGGQYQLLLPDGSKVWLNAASSIKYPTAFSGGERRVEITGEAYFEIAHNAVKPFKVMIYPADGGTGRGGEVEVLGTHFNINAYGDEQTIVTTLLEGKIKITPVDVVSKATIPNHPAVSARAYRVINPGEEAQINNKADIVVRKGIDTESAVAWMKGFFDFHNAGIKTVMKQVSRWYNVDVEYTKAMPEQTFEGNIDRSIPLNELLELLQQYGTTKFKIEGKTIKVQ